MLRQTAAMATPVKPHLCINDNFMEFLLWSPPISGGKWSSATQQKPCCPVLPSLVNIAPLGMGDVDGDSTI